MGRKRWKTDLFLSFLSFGGRCRAKERGERKRSLTWKPLPVYSTSPIIRTSSHTHIYPSLAARFPSLSKPHLYDQRHPPQSLSRAGWRPRYVCMTSAWSSLEAHFKVSSFRITLSILPSNPLCLIVCFLALVSGLPTPLITCSDAMVGTGLAASPPLTHADISTLKSHGSGYHLDVILNLRMAPG